MNWSALALLLLMPVMAAFWVLAVQIYLGTGLYPLTIVMVAALALFTYALNGLSDRAEDEINDGHRSTTLRQTAWWTVGGSALVMLVDGAVLVSQSRFNPLYPILTLVGIAYSLRVIPWPTRRHRITWMRLKDVVLIKNVVIGGVWATAVFVAPVMDAAGSSRPRTAIAMIAVTYAVILIQNSIFSDVRDEHGDREAGVCTLAVRWGARRCFIFTFVMMAVWCAVVVGCFTAGVLDRPTALLLFGFELLYPAACWLVMRRLALPRHAASAVIDSSDILFALGLIVLSRFPAG